MTVMSPRKERIRALVFQGDDDDNQDVSKFSFVSLSGLCVNMCFFLVI